MAHSEFFFDSYSDFTTSNEQTTNEMLAQSYVASTNCTSDFCCNQQYSITAVTTSTGSIAERYAYTAYGQPTILDASASVLSASAISNRYTYTGREWDSTLGLHHFRARWMSPSAGRFLGKDPIGYWGSDWHLYEYVKSKPFVLNDFSGTHDFPPGVNPDSVEDLIAYIKKLQRELSPDEFRKKLEEIRRSIRNTKNRKIFIGAEKKVRNVRNKNKPGRGGKGHTGGRKGICSLPVIKYLFLLECEAICAYGYGLCLDEAQVNLEEKLRNCGGLPFSERQTCIDNELFIWQMDATECATLYAACGLACLLPVSID
jgi:RHS repeat-associated protein